MRVLIEHGASVDIVDNDGWTALMYAARYSESPEVLKTLISGGAQVDKVDKEGRTALMYAAAGNKSDSAADVVKVLVEAGVPVDLVDNQGNSAIMLAVMNGTSPEVLKILMTAGVLEENVNDEILTWNTLMYAVRYGSSLELCLRLMSDLSLRPDENFFTLLFAATQNQTEGKENVLRGLIERYQDMVAKMHGKGYTALMHTARYCGTSEVPAADVVRVLIEHGASVDIVDNDGRTALMYAAGESESPEVLKILISAGAKVDKVDNDGGTALIHAAACNESDSAADVVRVLIEHGASVDIVDNDGCTALVYAARCSESPEVLKSLISGGAQVDKVNKEGRTALMYAAYRGFSDMVKMLVSAGAAVDKVDANGRTALMHAVVFEDTDFDLSTVSLINEVSTAETVKILIEAGAEVNKEDKNGWTALMHAACITAPDEGPVFSSGVDAEDRANEVCNEASEVLEVMRILIASGANVDKVDKPDNIRFMFSRRVTCSYVMGKLNLNAERSDLEERMVDSPQKTIASRIFDKLPMVKKKLRYLFRVLWGICKFIMWMILILLIICIIISFF